MLPQYKSQDPSMDLLQTQWKKQIDPLLLNPTANPVILKSISLTLGKNTVNHTLGSTLTGWKVIRQRGAATIYDIQDTNTIPDKTLLLMSSSGVNVDLEVF